MRVTFSLSSIFLLTVAVLNNLAHGGEHCEEDRPAPFNRMFHAFFKGPDTDTIPLPISESSLRWALGDCGNLEDFAQEAITYLEKYIDLSAVKRNPYVLLDNNDYFINPVNIGNGSNYRVVAESEGSFARYHETPVIWLSWNFLAKRDLVGPGGTLKANHMEVYGFYRFMSGGKEACIKTWTREPIPSFYDPSGLFDFVTFHAEWGPGAARGFWSLADGVYDLAFTFTFPANPINF